MRFNLESSRWYAMELLGSDFGAALRTYSPIKIYGVEPGGLGRRTFHLDFYHARYPEGVRDKRYHLQTIERSEHFILARTFEDSTCRYLLIHTVTTQWLNQHFHLRLTENEDPETWLNRNA